MLLSVIIPTYKRTDILRQCLECIGKQTLLRASSTPSTRCSAPRSGSAQHDREVFEVIVVSDGPDEKTTEMIASLSWPFEIQHFAIPKSQQGVARNRGVEKARGKISLLMSDDIFLSEDTCEKHFRRHEMRDMRHESPIAVLGFTTWDPTLKITPLMRWMEESGVQFGYPEISPYAHNFLPEKTQHFFTYASHISLPTRTLWQHPFREDVSLYGWEDVEWGRRLRESGVKLFYEPDARGYHHHAFTDAQVWERSRKLGQSAVILQRILTLEGDTELALVPRGFKKILYRGISMLPTYRGKHWRAFLEGMRE